MLTITLCCNAVIFQVRCERTASFFAVIGPSFRSLSYPASVTKLLLTFRVSEIMYKNMPTAKWPTVRLASLLHSVLLTRYPASQRYRRINKTTTTRLTFCTTPKKWQHNKSCNKFRSSTYYLRFSYADSAAKRQEKECLGCQLIAWPSCHLLRLP